MLDVLIAAAVILLVLLGWIRVQQGARDFAERHPELGPAREEGSGCGSGCNCAGGQCTRRNEH
jgi:hypothetical protein